MSPQISSSAHGEHECKNCHHHFEGMFCTRCGQKVIPQRNTLKHFFMLVYDSFDIHRGVMYTAKMLFSNPGMVIHDYLGGKTKCYYNPLKYLLIIAGIYAFLMIYFDILDANLEATKDVMGTAAVENKLQLLLNLYIKKYLSFIPIMVIPFWSIISRWIFKKQRLYYAEHLIIHTYLYAQYLVLITPTLIVFILFPDLSKYLMPLGGVMIVTYYSYAIGRIFKISLIKSFLSSLAIIVMGIIVFYIFIMLVLIGILIIMKLNGADLKEWLT